MIAVRYVHIRAKHIVVADLNRAAGVNHEVEIKIVRIANANSDPVIFGVFRPEPASLRERVVVANGNLTTSAHTAPAFHTVPLTKSHAERAIDHQTQSTHGT